VKKLTPEESNMEKSNKNLLLVSAMLLSMASVQAWAAPSAEQIAKLGNELTPLGAEQAGNAAGTIPAWTGGVSAPAGYKSGDHHPDPFADDSVKFTIDGNNMAQYADQLTPGQQAVLKTYDTFKMNVYPSHRSAAAPQYIYDATLKNASNAKLAEGGSGVTGAIMGIPFPLPSSGVEVIWNHVLRWRAATLERNFVQAPMTRGGDYTLVKFNEKVLFDYGLEGAVEAELDNVILRFKQRVQSPARLAGRILLIHETLDQEKEHRKAWVYNPGQRRVRRAPNVAFDNPGTAADDLRTSDQLDMFNGSPERYNWKLVGKKEIYVPYNSYKLHSDQLKYSDVLIPKHLNPEHLRYELHRVWVVDATLKEGARHIYKRRTFYIDEDSWQVLLVDQYDNRDQIWRVSEGHAINYYDVPNYWYTVEAHYDLQSGRYLALGLNNEEKMYDFNADLDKKDFTTGALRREGKR